MKRLILGIFAFVLLSVCSTAVSAQKATRINFGRGATSTIVTGTLNGYRSQRTFVIRVRRAQTLTTESAGKNYITVGVEAPRRSTYEQDMAADCHDRNEVTPTSAGDYRITFNECKKADRWRGTFRLRVSVR
ncbi:MAG: hypothetical protein ABIO36_06590 [Pyrinomonadaceae bacterium]